MDLATLQEIAITAALAASEKILEVYKSDDFDVSLKDDNSPLTKADLASQEIITQILESRAPGIPVLGEEGKEIPFADREKWNRFWLVDPLDGTKEFVKRNGEFTVNIALVENATPVVGVLYAPVKDTIYFAASGLGSFKAEKAAITGLPGLRETAERLPAVTDRQTPPVKVVASRSHFSPETAAYVERIKSKYGDVELVSAGSALKICLIAEGTADVYPRFGLTMEWDVGAGQVIAEEAGCTLVNADTGEKLGYNKKNLLNPYFIVKGSNFEDLY
jgi:3'(2'), 5'-bisphosphate nucleotidase